MIRKCLWVIYNRPSCRIFIFSYDAVDVSAGESKEHQRTYPTAHTITQAVPTTLSPLERPGRRDWPPPPFCCLRCTLRYG